MPKCSMKHLLVYINLLVWWGGCTFVLYFYGRYLNYICAYAVLLEITLCHLTQRHTVCVLYCK